jgi:hypothetical protein
LAGEQKGSQAYEDVEHYQGDVAVHAFAEVNPGDFGLGHEYDVFEQ